MSQISLTFPDGSARGFKSGVTGRDVAESIAKSLAKKAVAVQLDGKTRDLAEPIKHDARIRMKGFAHANPAWREEAWRDAEEIAAIADNLLVPSGVDAAMRRLKGEE